MTAPVRRIQAPPFEERGHTFCRAFGFPTYRGRPFAAGSEDGLVNHRQARMATAARSEPAPGSLYPWHHSSPAVRIGFSKRFFCSSVPWSMISGPTIERARRFTS